MPDKICSVYCCNNKAFSKGLCGKHYQELRRHGCIKDTIDKSNTMFELGSKVAKDNIKNKDSAVSLEAFRKSKINTKEVEALDGTKYIIKSDPMTFINSKTEEYNMLSGDYGMVKGVAGFQLVNLVNPKYITQAYILSEAINRENEIVSLKGVQLGEDTLNHPAACDSQIAEMLGYSGVTREYKACMKSLIQSGIIIKFIPEDKKLHEVYYFNPVFRCSGKGVTPRLFIMFYELFLQMSKKAKVFKYRFDNMANYTLTWLATKTKEYSDLIDNKDNLTPKEFNEQFVAIKNNIAKDYGLNLEIRLEKPKKINSPLEETF